MSTVAFIGLGIMGGPVSRHLVKAGHSVIGFNRSPGPVEQLVADGGKGAGSVAEAVREAEVIITMVPDSPDVEALALGEDGIYANAPHGSIHIDMSSIRPDVAARLADAGQAAGIRVMDAPVSGGETGATEGTLSIMVGANTADFEEVKPILEAMGTTVVLVGPPGSGQTVKAANQLIVAGTLELVAEAIVSSAPTALTPRPQSKCCPAGWPEAESWSARPATCSPATSSPDSGSTCTTRTWAS